jgi:hypothetical protein
MCHLESDHSTERTAAQDQWPCRRDPRGHSIRVILQAFVRLWGATMTGYKCQGKPPVAD